MSRHYALLASFLFVSASPLANSQQSLQSLHARVPAPPTSAAAAPAWLKSPDLATLRQQLKDQRAFVDRLHKDAAAKSMASASTGGIDFARAQRDPAYAQEVQQKLASMSQEEQMKVAMQMAKATQEQAVRDVQDMAADPESVQLAAERYPDYQAKTMTGGNIAVQQQAVSELQRKARAKDAEISARATKRLKCGDGEGSCSAVDQAADKATLRAAYAEILAEYDRTLVLIAQQVAAARQARSEDIAAAQKDLGPARYGAAAQSSANKQLLAAYHNTVLMEVEQLFLLAEDAAKFAAARVDDRKINFMPID